ncbi:hypothetical protein H7U19_01075 [Hyunsoonleella sp. SJ7]|uniref:Outer membrane protein beta-barrel domain-containing protein n=1 Tax=Hyunsoonleella aquatilis TaxID=2762758 RepID=A0A923H6H7_9FLAO|nr:hypothetical protein [Hyunsoonleella aquatilis]MBC3756976.1 hypothetical protein [Hyunsoonleella aquatilis]
MKKLFLGIAFAVCSIFTLGAQGFVQGTNAINVGAGFGGHYESYYSSTTVSPVFSVSYDRGIWEIPGPGIISLGGYVGHRTIKYRFSSSDYKFSQTAIGVRPAYHYNGFEIDELDLYAGFLLGYYFYSDNQGNNLRSYDNRLDHSGFIGARWFFTEFLAAFVEAGYGISNISGGVCFKF